MSRNDDWFDDYVIMQMMENEESDESDEYDEMAPSEKSGCLPGILWIILIVYIFAQLIR